MDGGDIGLTGGIIGTALGYAGWSLGTYFSIKNTNSPRERAFMIKVCVICWVALFSHSALFFTLPSPYRHYLWVPYIILLLWGVQTCNRTQKRIKEEESQDHDFDLQQ